MSNDPLVTGTVPVKYTPFDRSVLLSDLTDLGSNIGVTAMTDIIRKNMYVSYEFSGSVSVGSTGFNAGYRAIGYGPGFSAGPSFPQFEWVSFVTGLEGGITPGAPDYWVDGNNVLQTASIKHWYKWGARKFWLHHPFGRVSINRNHQEAMHYQPDAYYSAKHGCTCPFGGTLGNAPMPWITDDVVGGITKGFVPIFKALITGTAGDLSQDMWERLTGTGATKWYDPNDPIEIVVYNGTINQETFRKWNRWFSSSSPITNATYFGALGETEGMAGNVYARHRLEKSHEPFVRAGMRIAYDALPAAPGPIVGLNANPTPAVMPTQTYNHSTTGQLYIPAGLSYGEADAGWWSFFSQYVLGNWNKKDIFAEAAPFSIPGINQSGYTANPYLKIGVNTCSGDEFGRQGFNVNNDAMNVTTAARQHFLGELGPVEYVRSFTWSPRPHIGYYMGGATAFNGHYWHLRELAEQTVDSGSVPAPNYATGERTLRAYGGTGGYEGECLWGGHAYLDQLLRHQQQIGDPTPISQNQTIPKFMVLANGLRRVADGVMTWVTANLGITNDFNRAYPTINDYAKFAAGMYNFQYSMGLTSNHNYGASYPTHVSGLDINKIIDRAGTGAALYERIDNVSSTMFLDPYEYDTFAQAALKGNINGSWHTPISDVDLVQEHVNTWLDIKIKSWYRTFERYPKYICWRLTTATPYLDNQLDRLEMERYLFYAKNIPATTTESSSVFENERQVYFSKAPVTTDINGGPSLDSSGYCGRLYCGSLHTETTFIINGMLQKTKIWRNDRKYNVKVGVSNVPYLPKAAYSVYGLSGGQPYQLASVGWNASVFPKQITTLTNGRFEGGQNGWHTEAETEELKKCIRLEYRKRFEPIIKDCEFITPEINCTNPYEVVSDGDFESTKEWQKEILNLAYDLKTIKAWDPTASDSLALTTIPPSLSGGQIIPIINMTYAGTPVSGLTIGDPFTIQENSLFDYDKMNSNLVDWIRDDYLRPIRGKVRKVDGLGIRRWGVNRAISAMRSNAYTYSGRTADREWVLKWLQAEQGAGPSGATISWTNASSVQTNMNSFFDGQRKLSKTLLHRFDKGQPRIDIVNPYAHEVFAVGWNTGYSGDYPTTVDGMNITNVHPLIWVGWQPNIQGALRLGGETGPISSTLFNDFATRCRKVPKGRRVLLPYYWHQDPISDQTAQTNYYEATSDGATYTGPIPHRAHETPGSLKLTTPWAYIQAEDAKQSINTFFAQCAATGAIFDSIADDGESWTVVGVGSNQNSFSAPFGPTGMPAILGYTLGEDIQVLGTYVFPWLSWSKAPDPRTVPTFIGETRTRTLVNPFNGFTLGGAIEKKYTEIHTNEYFRANAGTLILYANSLEDIADVGNSAARIMEYYTRYGADGISAATGPIFVSSYAPPANNTNIYVADANKVAISPWRNPWNQRYDTYNGFVVNRYIAWLSQQDSIEQLVMGDLYKKMWIDNIRGNTISDFRKIHYGHYDVYPLGITESSHAISGNGHHIPHGIYPHIINSTPVLYGDINYELLVGKYSIAPAYEHDRNNIILSFQQHAHIPQDIPYTPYTDSSKSYFFYDGVNDIPARSYIALIHDVGTLRGLLRTNPRAWHNLTPWIWNPADTWWIGNMSFRDDSQGAEIDVISRTNVDYWFELIYHAMLSGTKHFHYFNPGDRSDSAIGTGFTAGLAYIQTAINDWKSVNEGCRVQPCSNASGDVNQLVDFADVSSAGGNHIGATGTLISGGLLLKYDCGKIFSSDSGAVDDKTYLWRVTAAPQANVLYRTGVSGDVGFVNDIPTRLDLVQKQAIYGVSGGFAGATYGSMFVYDRLGGSATAANGAVTISSYATVADSGAEVRHTSKLVPNLNTEQPYILDSGRKIIFELNGNSEQSVILPDSGQYAAGAPGSQSGLTIIGFYNLNTANGLHAQNGNEWGIERCIAFTTRGGSYWHSSVIYKIPTTGQYKVYHKELTGYSAYVSSTLKIEVSADGSQAKFFINNTLVDTVTAASVSPQGSQAGQAIGGLPIGQYAGDGVWSGAGVRDITLHATNGSPDSVEKFRCNFMSVQIFPNSNDAEVKINKRGAWIKRKRTSYRPSYKMATSSVPLPTGHLRNGSGFPTNDPEGMFGEDILSDMGSPAASLTTINDMRVLAAWKEDPIPFDITQVIGTVTVCAFHPSGIKKVEASLNGGEIATRTGQSGIGYGEFEFYLPPLDGALPPFENLTFTPAGASYGGMHQVRVKVFPYFGHPRILGGLPEENSRYYTPLPGSLGITPKKRDVNETSYFVNNIDIINDTKYASCEVKSNAATNNSTTSVYKDIRAAISYELGIAGKNKNHLDIVVTRLAEYSIPQVNDDGDIFAADNITPEFSPGGFSNPENKTVNIIFNPISPATGTTAIKLLPGFRGDQTNINTSYNGMNTSSFADTWINTSQIFTMALPNTNKAYGLSGDGRIYRLNKNPLTTYNGSTASVPSLSSSDWVFGGTQANWNTAAAAARRANFHGIGRIKLTTLSVFPQNRWTVFDRGILPNVFQSGSNQAISFDRVNFISSIKPSFDPNNFVENGNVSYYNCFTDGISGNLQNAFGFSRYVVGCTAEGVRGNVFSNAGFVIGCTALSCSKIDKANPAFFNRISNTDNGDARVKKNSMYMDTFCSGTYANCISLSNNNMVADDALDNYLIDHYDLLYKNLIFVGPTGVADRFEGYINNVHLVGISMPNALLFSPQYSKAKNNPIKFQKCFIDENCRMFAVFNEGQTTGNQIAQAVVNNTDSYFDSFGIRFGDINSTGNDAIVHVKPKRSYTPDPENPPIIYMVKGIPNKHKMLGALSSGTDGGNTLTPMFTQIHPVTGIKTFGLEMGGGYGPTAQGFTAKGLTLTSWNRDSFDATQIVPRLCWVYSFAPIWSTPGTTRIITGFGSGNCYEIGINTITNTAAAQISFNGTLSTFFNTMTSTSAVVPYDVNGPIHWMQLRNRTAATDTWSSSPTIQNIAALTAGNFPAGISAHWLNNGQNISTGLPWMAANQTVDILGTGANPKGRIKIAKTTTTAVASSLAAGLNSVGNTFLGGITITDQYGNLFRIDGGAGVFVAAGTDVNVNADKIKYASGSVIGTPWTASNVIGSFPREWIFNGDATEQYAPIKLEINMNNASLRDPGLG